VNKNDDLVVIIMRY